MSCLREEYVADWVVKIAHMTHLIKRATRLLGRLRKELGSELIQKDPNHHIGIQTTCQPMNQKKYLIPKNKTLVFDDPLMIHIISTSIMVGVIWVIQLVHYPSFKYVNESDYIIFQKYHMSNISYIVFPVMFTELITALIILFFGEKSLFFVLSLICLFLIWVITGVLFTKYHSILKEGKDLMIIEKMIKANWIRALLWTMRLIMILFVIPQINKLHFHF